MNAVGASPRGPQSPARWAASAQFTNTTCPIEPPLDPCHRRLNHLQLDKSYPPWLTNCSPPGRPPPGNRGLAPTALKMPHLPGLRTDDLALTGVKKQLSKQSPLCSRELSPKSYGCLAPEGRHLECRGRKPTAPRSHRRAGRRAHSSPTQLVPSSRPWIHAIEGPPFAAR